MSIFDAYDFVVTPRSSKQQFWVPTGEGNGVRPQRVTYESLTVEVFPVGSLRVKEARLGGVSGTAAFTEGTRDRLRDSPCERNFQTLASRNPDLRGVISVGSSFLPETLRGKGMGLAAYRLLVEHAGKMGLAVVPHYCDTGTPVTSADALRVWDKLAQVPGFDTEGHVVYMPPVRANPRKKRVEPVLDPRHLALVETLTFKRWFRDSKVVDRLGRPLVVYHGSPDIRDVFGGMTTFRTPSAFFATDVYGVADTYARGKSAWDYQNSEPGVIPVFVSMQNPMVVDGRGARFRKTEHYVHQAYRDGHDGIIILNSVDDYRGAGGAGLATVYAWFDPRQAKSAVLDEMRSRIDGKALSFAMPNAGTFDPTNPDIRMNPRAPRSLPRMASLFSGGGLVEAGLVGLVEPVFAVDCDAHVASAYEAAHGAHICVADVCDVALPQRGTVDYLHASPVCKTSSLAKRGSKKESTEDMKTAQATADAIRALRPETFTLENVPGYQKSASLGLITDALREEGYTFDAHVYDAADYGAPTHRTRLLLRAVREGELPSVPKPTHPVGGQADWYASVSDIIEAMPDTAIPKARKRAEDWMSLRLRAAGVDLSRLPRPLLVLGGSTGRGIPHVFAGSPAPTLKATTGEAHRIFLPDGRVKRLTPRGMARITGLPDDYPLPSAWGLAVKVIGNGVPPALARAIFGPLLQPAQAPKPHRPRSK